MKFLRSPWFRLFAGAILVLAVTAAAPGLRAQTPPPAPTPEVPAPLVAIPAADDGAQMLDNLSLSDNPLSTVLDLLERLTGRSVIRPQSLPTPTFTFNSHGPISKRDAIIALESLLTINSIAVAPMGEKFIKVVPVGNVRTEAPELVVGSLRDRSPSGLIVSKLFRLEYLDTASFQTQVQPFLGSGAPVVPFQNSNTVLVTDTISNLQRLEYVLTEVDKPRKLITKFYTLKFALAQPVADKIKSLIETTKTAFNRQPGAQGASGAGPAPLPGTAPVATGTDMSAGLGAALLAATTSLNFDERTNQVILVSDPSSVPFFDNLIEKLDVQAAPNTKIEVIQIQHAKAGDIAAMLSSFVSGTSSTASSSRRTSTAGSATRNQGNRTSQTGGRSTFPNQRQTNPAAPQMVMPQVANAGGERVSQFSDFMTIIPDERSNAIVVSGTQDDLNLIRDLIKQVDVVLPMVRIDVLIASVTLSKTVQRGIDAFTGIKVVGNKVVGIAGITGPGISVADILFKNGPTPGSFTANVSKSNTYSNVKVVANPSITTTHNQEATITIAKALPIITSSYTDQSSITGARNSYTYENIGLELTVTPLIGADGSIQLEIEQSADEVEGYTDNADKQPLIAKRSAKSFVTVADGEIIVFGGLQKDTNGRSRGGFPILSEIPLIGALFGSNLREKSRDEIIFFIQPRILRTPGAADGVARAQLEKSDVREMVQPYISYRRKKRPRPSRRRPIDRGPMPRPLSSLIPFATRLGIFRVPVAEPLPAPPGAEAAPLRRRQMGTAIGKGCLAAGLLWVGSAAAFPETLLKNPPFAPAGGPPTPEAKTAPRLELRGMFSLGGKPSFAVFDTNTQKAFWIGLHEAEGNVRVTAYDPAANAVTAEVDGQPQRLVMKEAQIITMVAPPPMAVAGAGPGPGPGGPTMVPGQPPTEQEIQERRNRIIEELRRRRAMRMGQPPSAPGQPPPPAPAQP